MSVDSERLGLEYTIGSWVWFCRAEGTSSRLFRSLQGIKGKGCFYTTCSQRSDKVPSCSTLAPYNIFAGRLKRLSLYIIIFNFVTAPILLKIVKPCALSFYNIFNIFEDPNKIAVLNRITSEDRDTAGCSKVNAAIASCRSPEACSCSFHCPAYRKSRVFLFVLRGRLDLMFWLVWGFLRTEYRF